MRNEELGMRNEELEMAQQTCPNDIYDSNTLTNQREVV